MKMIFREALSEILVVVDMAHKEKLFSKLHSLSSHDLVPLNYLSWIHFEMYVYESNLTNMFFISVWKTIQSFFYCRNGVEVLAVPQLG